MQLEEVQTKTELILPVAHKDKHFMRVNKTGLYEFRSYDLNRCCKLDDGGVEKICIKLVKTQIQGDKYSFMVLLRGEGVTTTEVVVEGRNQLEQLMRLIDCWTTISSFHQLMSSFKKIGEGSFAQVYEATTNYQHRIALKCFQKKNLNNSEKARLAFKNEVDLMKLCKSKYIVSYHYTFETDRVYYVKMEHFPCSLKKIIEGKMLVSQQKMLMRQLLLGLEEMKRKNMVHRDPKPDNIMIRQTKQGPQAVIIDLGLATKVDALPYIYSRCGTPGFLAPEIANLTSKKEKQQCVSDMFSLGCIFYKMLTKKYLFQGHTAKEVLKSNRRCDYDPDCLNQLSEYESSLLTRMLDPDPTKRITPAEALKHSYFRVDVDDSDEIPEEECPVSRQLKKINQRPATYKNMSSVYSSLGLDNPSCSQKGLSTIMRRKSDLVDSCLTFEGPPLSQRLSLNHSSKKRRKIGKSSKESSKHSIQVQQSQLAQQQSRFSVI